MIKKTIHIVIMASHTLHTQKKTSMPENESVIASGSRVEDSVPIRGATSLMWKWFGYKRSDMQ